MMNFKKTRNTFLAGLVAASMALGVSGCGKKTPNDIQVNLTGAVEAIETDNKDNFSSAINTIKKYAEEIRANAEKEGNTEDTYLADFMNELCLALEDLNEAEIGLTGVQGANHAGAIQYIKDIKDDQSDPDKQVSAYQEEKAAEYAENLISDYIKAYAYLNSSGEHMDIAVKGAGDDTYKDTIDRTIAVANAIEVSLDDYYDDIQEIFDLSPEQMDALKTISAEPKEEFEQALEEITGSASDSVKGNGDSFKDKLNSFIERFKQKVQNRWAEVKARVALLTERAKVGVKLREKQAELQGYQARLITARGDRTAIQDANNNIARLDGEIEALKQQFDAVSKAKDTEEYYNWLAENGYTEQEEVQTEVIAPVADAQGASNNQSGIIPPVYYGRD